MVIVFFSHRDSDFNTDAVDGSLTSVTYDGSRQSKNGKFDYTTGIYTAEYSGYYEFYFQANSVSHKS